MATKKGTKSNTNEGKKRQVDKSLPESYYRGNKKGAKPERDKNGFIIPG